MLNSWAGIPLHSMGVGELYDTQLRHRVNIDSALRESSRAEMNNDDGFSGEVASAAYRVMCWVRQVPTSDQRSHTWKHHDFLFISQNFETQSGCLVISFIQRPRRSFSEYFWSWQCLTAVMFLHCRVQSPQTRHRVTMSLHHSGQPIANLTRLT